VGLINQILHIFVTILRLRLSKGYQDSSEAARQGVLGKIKQQTMDRGRSAPSSRKVAMKNTGNTMITLLRGLISNRRRFTGLITLCLLGLASSSVFAHDDTGIFPINSRPYGKTYGQWTVAWWQWALSVPAANNPLTDTTGEFAGEGQSGPVWFLAGTFADSAERSFTMPAGKALLIPVNTWIFGAIAGDCDPSNPGVTCDIPTLRASADFAVSTIQTLDVLIDGRPVRHVGDYRAKSPGGFNVTTPEDAVLGLPTGTFGPHVQDGYWLMLEPLVPGTHNIIIRVVNPTVGLDYTVIAHITVEGGRPDLSQQSE
jgi:hypothetical protein